MTLFEKMKALAFRDIGLRGYFGSTFTTFRWFRVNLPQGEVNIGTCAVIKVISTMRMFTHGEGANPLTAPRVQIEIYSSAIARAQAAAQTVADWLETAHFDTDVQFGSPPVYPAGMAANFVENQFEIWEPQTATPGQLLETRIFATQEQ